MYANFNGDIRRMNVTYDLKQLDVTDHAAVVKRLEQFKEILDKEFTELVDIQIAADAPGDNTPERLLTTRVDMADLLDDIIVYCASEKLRWRIPPQTLEVVMQSNFSKLGLDGKPIKNPVTDKFEKGPNYWKPEPAIRELLRAWDANDPATLKFQGK
jgi:predicted HAD superfamily Cof-like phosphohydrolase